jgi:hypothetical protein
MGPMVPNAWFARLSRVGQPFTDTSKGSIGKHIYVQLAGSADSIAGHGERCEVGVHLGIIVMSVEGNLPVVHTPVVSGADCQVGCSP